MQNNFNDNKIDVLALNNFVQQSPLELIAFAEKAYFDQLELVSDAISQKHKAQILLIAGPSASSKTTTAHKLQKALEQKEIHSVVISLDDFYLDRNALPRLQDGSIDYESIHTLDLERLHTCFSQLLNDNVTDFPLFDFNVGNRSKLTRRVEISPHSCVIMEGLHALNPRLIKGFDKEDFLKLYISPNSDYYMNDEIVLTARDVRFIRRMIRDFFHRSSSISNTAQMWVNVIASEVHNIMPYKQEADFMIDSTVIYEPNIYVSFILKLMEKEKIKECHECEMNRIKKVIKYFDELHLSYLPNKTVIREFLE